MCEEEKTILVVGYNEGVKDAYAKMRARARALVTMYAEEGINAFGIKGFLHELEKDDASRSEKFAAGIRRPNGQTSDGGEAMITLREALLVEFNNRILLMTDDELQETREIIRDITDGRKAKGTCLRCSQIDGTITTYCNRCFAHWEERKRIIALAREKAERAAMKHRMTPSDVAYVDALVLFANELEAECE